MPSLRNKILSAYGYSKLAMLAFAIVVFFDLTYLKRQIETGQVVTDFREVTLDMRRNEKNLFLYRDATSYDQLMAQLDTAGNAFTKGREAYKTIIGASGIERIASLLGGYRAALQRYPEASKAYARASELAPTNAQLLADHADVLAMLQGQSAAGEPTRLIERALKLDPNNLKALALAGSAAFERNDFAAATTYWTKARAGAPAGSEFASALDRSLAEIGAGKVATVEPITPNAAAGAGVAGSVRLAPELADKIRPDDTVYIFARAAEGPRMPVAILRRKASELPINFTLDDSTAMSAELKLSGFSQVVVGARISRSGNATPQSGDLIGQSGPVKPGTANLLVTIGDVQP